MTVTIKAKNDFIGISAEQYGVDYDLVTIKETHKRNGLNVTEVRIARGKRDVVFSSGVYKEITVQDEETGRYLLKYAG